MLLKSPSKCTLNGICFCLQALAALPENKNVIFLKVDVDDASVSVRMLKALQVQNVKSTSSTLHKWPHMQQLATNDL